MAVVVGVDELKVGMFIHLDLGWMSHPFPRSSFRLENEQQIQTLRELGLKQLRWDPSRSLLVAPEAQQPLESERPVAALPSELAEPAAPPSQDVPVLAEAVAEAVMRRPRPRPEDRLTLARRLALKQQREAAAICEAQYDEAGRAWRSAMAQVRSDPQSAKRDTAALSQALLDKMLAEDELCIRVLNTSSGDRASGHSLNVAVVAMLLARKLDLPAGEVAELGAGALLHDVGKLDVPERLRSLDERFSSAERAVYAGHVESGLEHARRMGLSALATQVIGQHHENADGSGFPKQLRGDAISMAARIVGMVNLFDNMCNPAQLARAWTPHEALSRMFAHQRGKHDLTVLNAFIRMMGVYPAGSVVQLTDDRYALVISVNPERPLKPRVLTHDPSVPADEALHLDLAALSDVGIRRSLRAAQLPDDARDYLAPQPRLAYFFEPRAVPAIEALEV